MNIISRKNELPKITAKSLQAEFPDFRFMGPSSGWCYPVAETKTVIFAYGLDELVDAVQKHYAANEIAEPEYLVRTIHEWLCPRVPQFCEVADPNREKKINLWHLASRFYNAVKSAATKGLVPQEEAERKAAICATCPRNGAESLTLCSGCWTARFVKDAAESLSTRHTSLDHRLRTCELCECRLTLKVHVRAEDMQEKGVEWPPWCWMR